MRNAFILTVLPEQEGERIDKYLSGALSDLSRSAAAKLLEQGNVTVCSKPAAKNYKCRAGDVISVLVPPPVPPEAKAENIPLLSRCMRERLNLECWG